jgi:hypothetical protein
MEAAATEMFSLLSCSPSEHGATSWQNRELALRLVEGAEVLGLVGLLFELKMSCNLTRQFSKSHEALSSQLLVEPDDEDVKVLTLLHELGRPPEFEITGLRHWNRGSSADRIAWRRPFTHTVRTKSGFCEDCQRAVGMAVLLLARI